jgi:hypothetical protein
VVVRLLGKEGEEGGLVRQATDMIELMMKKDEVKL